MLSGYHPLKHCPLSIWCTVDIILLGYIVILDSAWMVHCDIILLNIVLFKHRPLRIVLGWCTVDTILLNIVLFRIVLGWCTVDIILLNIVLLG